MWPFGNRAKMIRLLNHLAFYNDKEISYARHSPAQAKLREPLPCPSSEDLSVSWARTHCRNHLSRQ
jgi:hypothetical protein